MKVAIIGCGTIANAAHIPAYLKNPKAEIKYFCDIIPERAQAAVAKYGCGTAITDYREILADEEVTAVSVCTPNNVHAPITIDCLRAGKHVLCEKPAARTYEEALEMQRAQNETGRVLNIGVVNRFNTAVNLIKQYIDSGKLGRNLPRLRQLPLTPLHSWAGWRLHYQGCGWRRCPDRLGRAFLGYCDVLLRRSSAPDSYRRGFLQAR